MKRKRNFDQICHFFVEEVGKIQKRLTKKRKLPRPFET